MAEFLRAQPVLQDASRWPSAVPTESPFGLRAGALLVGCGMLAAAGTLLIDLHLRLPGHAILRSILPMALGLALAPRRGAGLVMGAGAALTAAGFALLGWGDKGLGSLTSLLATGPALDAAVARAKRPRGVQVGLVLAGVGANLLALCVQCGAKLLHLDAGGGKPLGAWLLVAAATYPVCGAVAGLLAAGLLFRGGPPARREQPA